MSKKKDIEEAKAAVAFHIGEILTRRFRHSGKFDTVNDILNQSKIDSDMLRIDGKFEVLKVLNETPENQLGLGF